MIDRSVIDELKAGIAACEAKASFYSSLNVISRVALGKWSLSVGHGVTAFADHEYARLVPPTDKGTYYQAILGWLGTHDVVFVPEYMSQLFAERGFKVSKMRVEYIMEAPKLLTLEGGRLQSLRYDFRRAAKACTVTVQDLSDPNIADKFLALNSAWYKDAGTRMFRTYEKTMIDWLIRNWSVVRDIDPTIRAVAVEHDGRLISFEIGCQLCPGLGVSFTQRSDRETCRGVLAGTNLLASGYLAEAIGEPLINDGPAANKNVALRKDKLSSGTVAFYKVDRWRKR